MNSKPDIDDASAKLIEALQRSSPVTRMVDYGVPLGDALEVHRRVGNADSIPWDQVCEQLARQYLERAALAEAHGHRLSAAEALRSGAALLYCGQLAFNTDTPRKLELYESSQGALRQHARLAGDIDELTLPTPHGPLYGWAVRPAGVARAAVLILGGLSGWGMAYLDMARALAQRGILAVLGEGPGQGLTRLRSGVCVTPDTLTLSSTFLDYAQAQGARAFGAWGNSFGGLFCAHLAAADPRVAAVCINGAPIAPPPPPFRTIREQMYAAMGVASEDALAERLRMLTMSTDRHRIVGEVLVLEGGRDPVVALGEQAAFFSLASPERTHLMSWEDGEHTLYNHAAERNGRVADWFSDRLVAPAFGSPLHGERA